MQTKEKEYKKTARFKKKKGGGILSTTKLRWGETGNKFSSRKTSEEKSEFRLNSFRSPFQNRETNRRKRAELDLEEKKLGGERSQQTPPWGGKKIDIEGGEREINRDSSGGRTVRVYYVVAFGRERRLKPEGNPGEKGGGGDEETRFSEGRGGKVAQRSRNLLIPLYG